MAPRRRRSSASSTTGDFAHVLTLGADVRRPTLNLDERDRRRREDVDETFYASGIYLQDETELAEWASLLLGVRGEFHSDFDARALPQVGAAVPAVRGPQGARLLGPELPHAVAARICISRRCDTAATSWRATRTSIRSARSRGASASSGTHAPGWRSRRPASGTTSTMRSAPTIVGSEHSAAVPEAEPRRGAHEGVETRVLLRPHHALGSLARVHVHDTKVVDSDLTLDELPNAPRHAVDVATTVRLPRTETALTLEARWRDHAASETSGTGLLGFGSEEETPASWVFDMRVLQPIRRGIDLYVDLDNIGDERVVDSYPVRGRTFFVGIRARFDTTDRREKSDATNRTALACVFGGQLAGAGAADATVFTIAPGAEGKDTSPYASCRRCRGATTAPSSPSSPKTRASTTPSRRSSSSRCPSSPPAATWSRRHSSSPTRSTRARSAPARTRRASCAATRCSSRGARTQLAWNNKPDLAAPFESITNVVALGTLTCDATELVQDWISGAKDNNGFALTNPTDRLIGMYSFEATDAAAVGKKAKLVIETTGTVTEDLDGDCIGDAEDNCPASRTTPAGRRGRRRRRRLRRLPDDLGPRADGHERRRRGDACGPEVADVDEDGDVTKLDRKRSRRRPRRAPPIAKTST